MMLGSAKIETRCPVCHARYRVPSSSIGHKARCGKCRSSFRVAEVKKRTRAPTENEILDWLNEGVDDEYLAQRPRVILGGEPRNPLDPGQAGTSGRPGPTASRPAGNRLAAQRVASSDSGSPVRDSLQALRKTG